MPKTVLTNEELAPEVGWSADAIFQKTGIRERRIAAWSECSSDLAVGAAEILIREERIDPASIDLLILCTQTPDHFLPSTACLVHRALGLSTRCASFDLNQGCSGYVYALAVAHGWIMSGLANRALVLTADTYTKLIHPRDRSVRTLFGDGATASLVEASDEPGLSAFVFGTDGSGVENLIVPHGAMRNRQISSSNPPAHAHPSDQRTPENLFMNGPEIFTFSLMRVPQLVSTILQVGNAQVEDIDFFIFHQANRYMLDHLKKKMGISDSKMPMYHEYTGNTVSSTIPLLLEHCFQKNMFAVGQLLLLAGFGVGYSWSGCLFRVSPR